MGEGGGVKDWRKKSKLNAQVGLEKGLLEVGLDPDRGSACQI
jgi:hypothetical protein